MARTNYDDDKDWQHVVTEARAALAVLKEFAYANPDGKPFPTIDSVVSALVWSGGDIKVARSKVAHLQVMVSQCNDIVQVTYEIARVDMERAVRAQFPDRAELILTALEKGRPDMKPKKDGAAK